MPVQCKAIAYPCISPGLLNRIFPDFVQSPTKRKQMERSPTQFPELNAVLRELTERAHAILGDNFAGVYLQGSFAVGDADIASDCDFLIPVNGPITAEQEAGLRALHREIVATPGYWTHHLEGSYPD